MQLICSERGRTSLSIWPEEFNTRLAEEPMKECQGTEHPQGCLSATEHTFKAVIADDTVQHHILVANLCAQGHS